MRLLPRGGRPAVLQLKTNLLLCHMPQGAQKKTGGQTGAGPQRKQDGTGGNCDPTKNPDCDGPLRDGSGRALLGKASICPLPPGAMHGQKPLHLHPLCSYQPNRCPGTAS